MKKENSLNNDFTMATVLNTIRYNFYNADREYNFVYHIGYISRSKCDIFTC